MIVIMLGFGMIAPILPLYGRTFGVSSALVGFLVTSFGLARLFANIPAGRLADRIGRRPLIITGPAVTALGALIAAIAPDFWTLVAARFIQGIGSAIFATAAMTVLADISTPDTRGRMMTIFQGSLLIGTSFGPALGGLTAEQLSLRGVFYIYAALSLFAAVWAFVRIRETLSDTNEESQQRQPESQRGTRFSGSSWALLASTSFLAVAFVSLTIFFTRTGSRSTVVPLLGAERLQMTESTLGVVLTVAAVVNVMVLPVAGWGIDRFGRKPVIVPSMFVSALGIFLFALSPNVAMFFVAAAVLGIGTGIAGPAPAAYVADLARGQNYGATMGLFRTTGDLGFVIGPVLLGWLVDWRGFAFSLYVNAALLFLAGLVFAIVAREIHRPQEQEVTTPETTTRAKTAQRAPPD